MHTPPGGVQIPQLELQHTVPEGHIFRPHLRPACDGARCGFRQTPLQSRPPRRGSHIGFPTQVSPCLHISPAIPPQLCPTSRPILARDVGAAPDAAGAAPDAAGAALDTADALGDAGADALAGGTAMSGASAFGVPVDAHAVTSNNNNR